MRGRLESMKMPHKIQIFRITYIRKLMVFLVLFIFSIITIIILSRNSILNDFDRTAKLNQIDTLIKEQASSFACKQPNLPVDSPEIMRFIHSVPELECSASGEDWVKCVGHECSIQENVKIKYGPVKCTFTDLMREDDFQSSNGESRVSETTYELVNSDVVRVSCTSPDKTWSATLTGIRRQDDIWDGSNWDHVPQDSLKMDVLMFGFDSLSRNAFIRKLPKSYKYLTQTLGGIVLQGYNIVGDGTPQALIPILTGKTELELPDTRKRIRNTEYVNSYPFIWNDFKDAGYVTGFFEDVPELGTFTYRLNGFDEPPTDHYMRPYYLASLGERHKWPKYCTGEIPRHKVMLNAIKDFFTVYKTKPKFLFGFHGELSHDDYNLIGIADDDLLEFMKDLKETGALNNSVFILMADHGHRFADVRNTIQGKQEERLPFFSFTFPKWFKEKHLQLYNNILGNQNKLTTPFDIYTTLKNVLHLDNVDLADISQRSVSLFSMIPAERSCYNAYIEPHWCACLDWRTVPLSDPIVERLGDKFIKILNNYTNNNRNLCEELSISQIEWVKYSLPNDYLLKFKQNADLDGFVADLSAKMKIKYIMYQIKVMLIPGKSLFEATITHDLTSDELDMNLSDVSRINLYGRQARCIENELPQLRKYCYCNEDIS